MERQVALVLVALLQFASSCEFQERPSRAPEPLLLASPLELVPDSDADSCRARCCARAACDAAVLGLPQDAPAQCFLLSCGGACPLREDNNSQFRVFTRSDVHAPDTSLQLVPLILDPSTRTEEQRNSTNGTVVCTLPRVIGLCKAAFPRFHFDAASGACQPFIYGGCGGNGNNFESREECVATCPGVKGADDEKKPQPKSARMAMPPQTELSENDPEETLQYKEMTQKEFSELCLAPLVVGPCRAAFTRWFFNGSSGRCERFIYGGCRGNKNNYEQEERCTSTCAGVKVLPSKKQIPPMTGEFRAQCGVAPDSGPCRAAFPMFYFDPETQSCKTFLYGGCKGNNNRYDSEDRCMEKCVNTAYAEGQGKSRSSWTAAFFLFFGLAAVSFLLLTALIFITLKRNRTPTRTLSVRSDKEELLPDSESVDSLPLPESPGKP
ncbi:kunitz-type protease inhibitor 2 [Eucyclogobius newberryi]|uniref:kunitz-type protease inhibitor 2 n=1 Tax=Eucyclogobius newberryi TaxID=166745 RepID=UPI003B5B9DD6